MNIIIDTNIFISALIKRGLIRLLIEDYRLNILFPEFEFREIEEHKEEIIKKTLYLPHTKVCGLFSGFLDAQKLKAVSYYPILKNWVLISDIRKSGLTEKEFNIILLRLLRRIHIIPSEIVINFREEAKEIMDAIDLDDTPFIATALAFNCPI